MKKFKMKAVFATLLALLFIVPKTVFAKISCTLFSKKGEPVSFVQDQNATSNYQQMTFPHKGNETNPATPLLQEGDSLVCNGSGEKNIIKVLWVFAPHKATVLATGLQGIEVKMLNFVDPTKGTRLNEFDIKNPSQVTIRTEEKTTINVSEIGKSLGGKDSHPNVDANQEYLFQPKT